MATFAKKNDHWYMTIVKGDKLWSIGDELLTQYRKGLAMSGSEEARIEAYPLYEVAKGIGIGVFHKNGDASCDCKDLDKHEYASASIFATNIGNWNDIPNINLIYPGEVFWLTRAGAKAAAAAETKSVSVAKAVVKQFGVKSTSENGDELFASWTWSKQNATKTYKIEWFYDTGDNIWYGSTSENNVDSDNYSASRWSEFTIPSDKNVRRVRFRVKPIPKTLGFFAAQWSDPKYHTDLTPVETPSAPPDDSLEISDDLYITVTLEGLESDIAKVQFQVVKDNDFKDDKGTPYMTSGALPLEVTTGHVSWRSDKKVETGSQYKVRYRVWDLDDQKSDWSPFSGNQSSKPNKPNKPKCQAYDETTIIVNWDEVATAKTYEVQYHEDETLLVAGNGIDADLADPEATQAYITDMTSGTVYFFRVRALTEDGKESDWSEPSDAISIGEAPAQPTTWSSTTVGSVEEDVILYWTHNPRDGSWQREAIITIEYVNSDGTSEEEITVEFTEEDSEDVSSYIVEAGSYTIDTTLTWKVRTKGAYTEYGEDSNPRTVKLYEAPSLGLILQDMNGASIIEDELTSFPLNIETWVGPESQMPIGFYLTIAPREGYDTVDQIGNSKWINPGEIIYSKHFDTNDWLDIQLSAGDLDLSNGVKYDVRCVVTMNSGLTAVDTQSFTVSWEDKGCEPNAQIGINLDSYTATVRPYCEEYATVCYAVTYNSTTGLYTRTAEAIDDPMGGDIVYAYRVTYDEETGLYTKNDEELIERYGTIVSGVKTTTGESVYYGTDGESDDVYFCEVKIKMRTTVGDVVYYSVDSEGNDIYYCKVEEGTPIENVLLSVYRREYDGSFTLLAEDCNANTNVHDPHPSLDLARYRIVAIDQSTGTVSYTDLPGVAVGVSSVIIQWDEQWTNFEVKEGYEPAEPAWSGSLIELPYNIDISTNNTLDVSLVEYIGRSHPVSYYGTQIGESATWSVEIPKSDVETLYALRRLARWMGDVYVREPSGTGYWANIGVSFNQKHNNLTIPVSLSITRVEGGM